MGVRIGLALLLLALAALVAESSSTYDATLGVTALGGSEGPSTCNGQIGDCIGDEEEMLVDSESSRRTLAQSNFIGYGAMKANRIPCSNRGSSYYNCDGHQNVNPYSRGCKKITQCKRG